MAVVLSRPVKDFSRKRELGVASGERPWTRVLPEVKVERRSTAGRAEGVAGYYLDRPQVAEEPRAGPVIT